MPDVPSGEPFARETKARYVFVDGRLYEPEEEDKKDARARPAAGEAKTEKVEARPLPPLPSSPPPFPAGKAIAITGGTILSVGPQGDIPGGTVLIRDGKIAAVGKDVAVPEGAIVIDAKGRYAGACGINNINTSERFANLGYWVRSSLTGQGIAPSAVRELVRWTFAHTTLNRLEIVAALGNTRSQRVAEKVGAERDGVLKQRLFLQGKPCDAVMYSLVRARSAGP